MPNLAKTNKQKKYGFTLIELLIVMTIVGTILSLVGPLAIDALTKAQARSELLSLQTWLTYQSKKAFVTGQSIHLSFDGKQALLLNMDDKSTIVLRDFDHVFFQPQDVIVDSHGMSSTHKLDVTFSGKNLVVSLADWTDENERL